MSNNFVSQIQVPPPSAPIKIPVANNKPGTSLYSRLRPNGPPLAPLIIPQRTETYVPGPNDQYLRAPYPKTYEEVWQNVKNE
jgi:hypothetical protein